MVDGKTIDSVSAMGPIPAGIAARREQDYEPPEMFRKFLAKPTVGDLLKHITARLSDEGIAVPDWWSAGRYWHKLVYELYKDPGAPSSLKEEFFESDGPYLKSVTVREYLFPMMAFQCTYVGDYTEIMNKYSIRNALAELKYTPQEYRDFLEKAVTLAKERFAPLQEDVNIRLR